MENNSATNPFPGLRPFEEDEEHLFFGREKSVTELLARLRESRFLAVIGASGSGKSSLVKAGILPSLYRGFMAGVDSSWRVALFRPGDAPISSLAEALTKARIFYQGRDDDDEGNWDRCKMIEAALRRSDRGLIDIVKETRLPGYEKLLLVVDQFEELFRFNKLDRNIREERPEATTFVNLLLESLRQETLPIYIVLTMRSDFLGDCTEFMGLPEAINNGLYLIPRMTREEKRVAVTGPVAVGGAEMTSPLLARLLNDVGNKTDQLPILQHALMRTWEYWIKNRKHREPLDLPHYEDAGTMEKALDEHAEEAYVELKTQREQVICEKMFKLLTDTGKTGRAMRRPAKVEEIRRVADASEEEVINVINVFRQPGRTFLMPPGEVKLSGDSVIDISHESLMRIWDRLIQWVKEEAESAEFYVLLAKAAVRYQEDKTRLWGDPDLMLGLKWREENKPNAEWAQRYYDVSFERADGFLDASKEQQDLELAEKIREQKRKTRRKIFRVMAIVVSIACVILAYLTVLALKSRRVADRRRVEAEDARKMADSSASQAKESERRAIMAKNKATVAQKLADKNAKLAENAKKDALQKKEEAEKAKVKAEVSRKKAEEEELKAKTNEMIAKIQGYIVEMNQARDKFLQYLAKANELAAHSLAQSENKELKALPAITAYELNHQAYVNLDESTDETDGKFERLKRLDNPEIKARAKDFKNKYEELQETANNQWVPAKIFEALRDAYITKMEADEDILAKAESWALTVTGDGKVVFNDREGRLNMASLQPNENKLPGIKAPMDVSKRSPLHVSCMVKNGHQLLCGTREGGLLSWNLNSLEETKLPYAHNAKIQSMAFSTQTNTLVYSIKNAAYAYDFKNKPQLLFKADESDYIRALVVIDTADNSILLTADEGGHIFYYNLDKKGEPKQLYADDKSTGFHAMVYNQQSTLLAASNSGGNIILFPEIDVERLPAGLETKALTLPKKHKGIVYTIAISPNGKYLASAGWDGAVVLWDTAKKKQGPLISIICRRKVLSLVFDSKGEYLIFSDEENLRICPTSPGVFYKVLNKTKKRQLTPKEWSDYVGESIKQGKTR